MMVVVAELLVVKLVPAFESPTSRLTPIWSAMWASSRSARRRPSGLRSSRNPWMYELRNTARYTGAQPEIQTSRSGLHDDFYFLRTTSVIVDWI